MTSSSYAPDRSDIKVKYKVFIQFFYIMFEGEIEKDALRKKGKRKVGISLQVLCYFSESWFTKNTRAMGKGRVVHLNFVQYLNWFLVAENVNTSRLCDWYREVHCQRQSPSPVTCASIWFRKCLPILLSHWQRQSLSPATCASIWFHKCFPILLSHWQRQSLSTATCASIWFHKCLAIL